MASIEAPLGISFVYGFDYHPEWYTQIKPAAGFGFGNNVNGSWTAIAYQVAVEHRYYYNILKRERKGKTTVHRSADFISVKPSFRYLQYSKNAEINSDSRMIYSCPVSWGLRRAMGNRFYFDGSIGCGPYYFPLNNRIQAAVELYLGVGFVLSK